MFALAAATLAEPGLSAAARGRLRQIVGQAEWLTDMIDDFMHDAQRGEPDDIGGAGLEDTGLAAGPQDVVRIANEVITAGRLTWPCDVIVDSPGAPARCSLPPVLVRRILSNVLGNAARAAGSTGTVTVQIRRCAGLVVLVVDDTGPGFGQIPSGAGLGLSAVARTIVGYGGRVECGRGPGGGARVSLWLP
jgi:signal transduction histidine kinase